MKNILDFLRKLFLTLQNKSCFSPRVRIWRAPLITFACGTLSQVFLIFFS